MSTVGSGDLEIVGVPGLIPSEDTSKTGDQTQELNPESEKHSDAKASSKGRKIDVVDNLKPAVNEQVDMEVDE